MKKLILLLSVSLFAISATMYAQCPAFSVPLYPDLTYNLNATPFQFEMGIASGDTVGCTVNWYRYLHETQSKANAVLYTGPGSNTVSECFPQTDEAVRNTFYDYYCVITTPSCPNGVESSIFTVQVAYGSDCMTMDGTSFKIESAPKTYDEGGRIQLTAYYSGYGGVHYYTWYHDGEPIEEDANHIIYNDPDDFQHSVLTIPASEVADAGRYSVQIMDGPDCTKKTSSFSITVNPREPEEPEEPVYLVFDDKNDTHVWSDPKNWWPDYNRIPNLEDSAVVRRPCRVDIAMAQARDVTIDMTGGNAITIQPSGALSVAGRLLQCKAGDLIIESDASGNGAIVLSRQNRDIPATVQFFARSSDMDSHTPIWQYIGYPMQEHPAVTEAYPGAALYEWTNTPNVVLGGNWQPLEQAEAEAFRGYCMTQAKQQTYTFSGLLNNPETVTVTVPYNNLGNYPGFAFMANSWVAPIDIARMELSDFGDADATVYIMNTGTYAQAVEQQIAVSDLGQATHAGQYNAIPVHAAEYMSDALTVIPPMQGFFVHTNRATELSLDYNRTIFEAATRVSDGVNTTPTRAPKRNNRVSSVLPAPSVFRLTVEGTDGQDQLYILTSADFTDRFDNGWDARKMYGPSRAAMIALSPVGPLSVAAVPQAEGTGIAFFGEQDQLYTLSISTAERSADADLWLFDSEQNAYAPLTDGTQYTFTATAQPERFRIVHRGIEELMGHEKAVKFIRNGALYLRLGQAVYDAHGHRIQ